MDGSAATVPLRKWREWCLPAQVTVAVEFESFFCKLSSLKLGDPQSRRQFSADAALGRRAVASVKCGLNGGGVSRFSFLSNSYTRLFVAKLGNLFNKRRTHLQRLECGSHSAAPAEAAGSDSQNCWAGGERQLANSAEALFEARCMLGFSGVCKEEGGALWRWRLPSSPRRR